MTKICGSCGLVKDTSEFTNRGGERVGQFQSSCKDCRLKKSRTYKRKMSSLVKRWKLRKGCSSCGFKAEHSCQLDIDHIEPKKRNKSCRQAINTGWSKKRLKKELSKCQVLCANCHRLKTFKDGTMFKKSTE